MCDILVENGTVITMDPKRRIIKNGSVAIDGNRIIDVGEGNQLRRKHKADRVINAKDKIVLPGLVNSHTHAMHILLRGLCRENRELYNWLYNSLLPGLNAYTSEDASIATRLYCMEAIRSGITTVVDNPTLAKKDNLTEAAIAEYKKIGMRTIYAWLFFDGLGDESEFVKAIKASEPGIIRPSEADINEDTNTALRNMEKIIKKHDKTENGRINVWPAPAVAVMMKKEGLLGSLELARKYDTMLTVHIAETKLSEMQHGMRCLEYLATIGFLDRRVLAAHCVWLNDRDIRLLKINDVKVSHQAVTNMLCASGVAPIPKMISQGITVGIGTDDGNANDTVNMFQLMKVTALLHKVTNLDANVITAEKVLEMATIDGAKAVGKEKEIGSIEKGKKADLIILDTDLPQMVPRHHLPTTLIYQTYGNEVDTAIIDGKILMEGRNFTFMDREQEMQTLLKAQKAADEISERAKMGEIKNRGWKTFV